MVLIVLLLEVESVRNTAWAQQPSPMQSLLCERMKPRLQRQLKEPMVFLQVPLPHASLSHSLISTKEQKRNNPLPQTEGKKIVPSLKKKILHTFTHLMLISTKIIKGPTIIYFTGAPISPPKVSIISLIVSILKSQFVHKTHN